MGGREDAPSAGRVGRAQGVVGDAAAAAAASLNKAVDVLPSFLPVAASLSADSHLAATAAGYTGGGNARAISIPLDVDVDGAGRSNEWNTF